MTTTKKAAKPAKKKATKVNRSAKSGKFVSDAEAKANPDTTVKETVKRERLR